MIVENNSSKNNGKISRLKTPLKIKVISSRHGYGFVFRDLSGKLIDSHIGLLPSEYPFTKQTGELFALIQAFHRLNCPDMSSYRVALVCSSLPLAGNTERQVAA